eukprot:gene8623-biopygen110
MDVHSEEFCGVGGVICALPSYLRLRYQTTHRKAHQMWDHTAAARPAGLCYRHGDSEFRRWGRAFTRLLKMILDGTGCQLHVLSPPSCAAAPQNCSALQEPGTCAAAAGRCTITRGVCEDAP